MNLKSFQYNPANLEVEYNLLVCLLPKLMASASGVQPWRFLTLTGAPCANNNWMQSEWNQSFTLYAM